MSTDAERLQAAEQVCLMLGWSASQATTPRQKALNVLWKRWRELVPDIDADPEYHPELSDEVIEQLAVDYDFTRMTTLDHFFGSKSEDDDGG